MRADEQAAQAQILRDIIGNPFRRLAINRQCVTRTVAATARSIYDDRRFDRLPDLADALEAAGCETQDILSHCRSEGPHVRGCWAVDIVLANERG